MKKKIAVLLAAVAICGAPMGNSPFEEKVFASSKSSLDYTTNDRDTAKKGNSGVYSYKKSGNSYDIYYIIDFDEGYVYNFTDGNGNDICDRLKIESGTLNDVLLITYHDGGYEWTYGLHFKYQDFPETLILEDNDHVEWKFSTTSLEKALAKRDTKEMIDY